MPAILFRNLAAATATAFSLASGAAAAAPLSFSSATATFAQSFDRNWAAAEMIDGITSGNNGWAIFRNDGQTDQTRSETALFTLSTPLAAGVQAFRFVLTQNYGFGGHTLGDFSLAYTTDAVPTLASASTLVNISSVTATAGVSLNIPTDGRVVVSGALPDTDLYTVVAFVNAAAPVTGFFLNAINDPAGALPTGGPGRQPQNGNFVLTEFSAATLPVPEPAPAGLMLAGLAGVAGWAARSRRRRA